ncbi:hypothetical protein [Nonomuraea sp. GTA35]|uniref:hypothetical protein n=1 Tax=Nonomuraea sp. GTA35 TaxID=1676746 RepID=UPI0035C112D4
MTTAERLLARAEHVDPGHPGVWPDGELPEARLHYDRMLAEQDSTRKASTR